MSEAPRLRLLNGVTWCGGAVPGGRGQALLAVLVSEGGRPVAPERLAAEIWGHDEAPASPGKALQVLVSRTRAHTGPELVGHSDRGYRLAVEAADVDALVLAADLDVARSAFAAGDLVRAVRHAEAAAATPVATTGAGPLAELRDTARDQVQEAGVLLGRGLSALGEHATALPHLEAALVDRPHDEELLVRALRSEAAVRGAPAALERYEQHRRWLRDELGSDPGVELRVVHAELLASDQPVRSGLRSDASSLVGRDDDLRELRAAVATSRVVTILGPGGLGKTRMANVLAREARESVVHLVELVGVRAEDVVGEIGSALGVRDSVSGRRVLTPEQRADVRARIAEHLDRAPSLLVLDNCEHVIEVVADLVAFLVATTARLTVVTTSRAPLAIAAERVFALGRLDTAEAASLFVARAQAARPDVDLPPDGVRRVVDRLDGLPLAIELAAARTRAMTVEDIADRLADRFALLQGGDRSAPDRHRTLMAVVDWSWQLLAVPERRALERLALFPDGFDLSGADALLPDDDALAVVAALVDQSLLGLDRTTGRARYRMLETVREFGLVRLREHGEEALGRQLLESWALARCAVAIDTVWTDRQVEVVDALLAEETNLVEVLRVALSEGRPEEAVVLLAALSSAWTIRGDHGRVVTLLGAVEELMTGWEPTAATLEATVLAMGMMLINSSVSEFAQPRACRALLRQVGDRAAQPAHRAMARVLVAHDPTDSPGTRTRLDAMHDDPDHRVAAMALMWSSHSRENAGDPEAAIEVAERALALTDAADGPWQTALLHAQLSALHTQLGRTAQGVEHARRALPVLDSLGAADDSMQARSVLAAAAIGAGRFEEAQRWLEEMSAVDTSQIGLGGAVFTGFTRAELALAMGAVAAGLDAYRDAVRQMHELRYPGMPATTGLEPWILFVEAAALTAHARHGTGDDGADLFDSLRRKVPLVLDPDDPDLDYPVSGSVLFGIGAWGLLRGTLPLEIALTHLALAQGFAYSRMMPSLGWPRIEAEAEERAPGRLAAIGRSYAGRRGPELLAEARALVVG